LLIEIYRAAVPSGASTGKYEAVELRDNDPSMFQGKGVSKAIDSVNRVIAPALIGIPIDNQKQIDEKMIELDATDNKGKLGANAILSVSLAFARAMADVKGLPLSKYINNLLVDSRPIAMPTPYFNVINGGSHAGNFLGFQEFMIVPNKSSSFKECMRIGCEVYQRLKSVLKERYGLSAVNVGDEGGFAPQIESPEEALDLIILAIHKCNLQSAVSIALDVAASGIHGVSLMSL
jgi:enolase